MFKGNGGFIGKSGITGRLSHTGIRSFSGLQQNFKTKRVIRVTKSGATRVTKQGLVREATVYDYN